MSRQFIVPQISGKSNSYLRFCKLVAPKLQDSTHAHTLDIQEMPFYQYRKIRRTHNVCELRPRVEGLLVAGYASSYVFPRKILNRAFVHRGPWPPVPPANRLAAQPAIMGE